MQKRLARQENIPLHEAQDQVALAMGFKNWSLLVRAAQTSILPR